MSIPRIHKLMILSARGCSYGSVYNHLVVWEIGKRVIIGIMSDNNVTPLSNDRMITTEKNLRQYLVNHNYYNIHKIKSPSLRMSKLVAQLIERNPYVAT